MKKPIVTMIHLRLEYAKSVVAEYKVEYTDIREDSEGNNKAGSTTRRQHAKRD